MVITKENSLHYNWGQNCDGWHLLKSDSLSVIQERMPAGTSEEMHYHERSQQLFFILSGTANMEINGAEYTIHSNQSMHIPKGVRHKIKNTSNQDLHFLVISEPKSHGDRISC
jgi:mannose-6-phosphate isomerase-like protein (cupin superfamily)